MMPGERDIVLGVFWLIAACTGAPPAAATDPVATPRPAVPPKPSSSSGVLPSVQGGSVESDVNLYRWIRAGLSIHEATISAVGVEPADPGKERVTVTLEITATLWGAPGERRRSASFVRPQSSTARKKFPDPLWGRVSELGRGVAVVVVTPQPDADLQQITFIDDAEGPDDPIVEAMRSVVEVEKTEAAEGRLAHYVRWLDHGPALHRRFAAEAVSRDTDLPRDDAHDAAVARAYAQAIDAETQRSIRIELLEHATRALIGRLRPQQAAPLVRAALQATSADDELVRGVVLDWLLNSAQPEQIKAAGASSAWASTELSGALERQEVPAGERGRIEAILDALRR